MNIGDPVQRHRVERQARDDDDADKGDEDVLFAVHHEVQLSDGFNH